MLCRILLYRKTRYWSGYYVSFRPSLPPLSPQMHVVLHTHRHLTEPVMVAKFWSLLPVAATALAPPLPDVTSITDCTFCALDIFWMYSVFGGTNFFIDRRLALSICWSWRLDVLPMLGGAAMSSSYGKRHTYMPPSTLVLTRKRPSGLIFTLVTTPACPTPTCVGTPSTNSHTFTIWSELPVIMYLPEGKFRDETCSRKRHQKR